MSLLIGTNNFSRHEASKLRSFQKCESSDDDGKRLKRREKNRVAAQRSRKRQIQKADELHKAYVSLEQENTLLKKEVQLLIEEQRRLSEALRSHEPLCPVMTSGVTTTRSTDTVGVITR